MLFFTILVNVKYLNSSLVGKIVSSILFDTLKC